MSYSAMIASLFLAIPLIMKGTFHDFMRKSLLENNGDLKRPYQRVWIAGFVSLTLLMQYVFIAVFY
jgi:hypothetical protein